MSSRVLESIALLFSAAALGLAVTSARLPALLGMEAPPLPHAAAAQPERTLSVSGEGEVEISPDRALITLVLESRSAELNRAKSDNDDKVKAMLESLKPFNIADAQIKTLSLQISPHYRDESSEHGPGIPSAAPAGAKPETAVEPVGVKGPPVLDWYSVSRTLQITVDALDSVENVLQTLTRSGVQEVRDIQFTLRDPEVPLSEARAMAVKTARTRAEQLAKEAGVTLGQVMTVTPSGGYIPAFSARGMMMKAASAEAAPPVLAGTQNVSQHVTMVYQIQ